MEAVFVNCVAENGGRMELKDLRHFLAVARERTISGAADSLYLTQPTLSRQMMELVEELGKIGRASCRERVYVLV